MNCVSHITHGLWRLPGNNRELHNDIEYWIELARLLEAGGFDAVFLADVIGTYDVFRGSADTSIREGLQIPNNDPSLVVPALDWLLLTRTAALAFGYLPARGITMPADLHWLQSVVRTGVTPVILLAVTVALVMLLRPRGMRAPA